VEEFKIYIDRLKGGGTVRLDGNFDPSFFEIQEPELQFHDPVALSGEAYLTDDHLVLHWTATTKAEMPCAICNEMTKTPLTTKNFYHTEPLSEIPSAIFDFSTLLREALLIELPGTTECNEGHCPSREIIKPFLRPDKRLDKTEYFPFSNMDLNN
jgi:uncharacterized metal-binding protein YceD (DUF177 family)